jgi:1-acyl-sn-glycerol-3-phosphate acyltransferase
MTVQEAPARRFISLVKMVWLNFYFGVTFLLVSLVFGIGGGLFSLGHFLLFRNKRRTLRVFRRTISHYGTAVCNCGWPLVRVKYVDHSPQEVPPFIFVSNHRSASDAFLMSCLPFECVQVVNIWPYKIPLVWLIGTIAGYLRVREMPFDEFLAKGTKLIKEGVSIIAFPEGTRSGSRRMGPFHGSAFRLARATGVKIVPLAISGNENIPRRGSVLLHPGRIIVRKLPAIKVEQYGTMSPYQLKTLAREMIQQHLDIEGPE